MLSLIYMQYREHLQNIFAYNWAIVHTIAHKCAYNCTYNYTKYPHLGRIFFFNYLIVYFFASFCIFVFFNFYNIVLVSAIQQCKSAIIIHISLPSSASFFSPHLSPPGYHRVPDWAPCAMQQFLTSYLSYTW